MVEPIRAYARSDASVLGQQGLSQRVLEATGQTKRHLFIAERSCSIAYADMPIPIDLGQTISQPYIVGLMTQLAEVAPEERVTLRAPCDRSGRSAWLKVLPGLTPNSIPQKYAQTVTST